MRQKAIDAALGGPDCRCPVGPAEDTVRQIASRLLLSAQLVHLVGWGEALLKRESGAAAGVLSVAVIG